MGARWTRDGDQWVATINDKEARISEWIGMLGSTFHVAVAGKSAGSTGGGNRAGALARAKTLAVKAMEAA